MFIGKQFVWEPVPLTYETSYLTGPPSSITSFSGPYYNCDGYSFDVGTQWAGFGVRKRDLITDDTTDIDVRLFSDYTGIFSGFIDILETSALGEGDVDFVMIDGHYAGGKVNYYPGVYSFYGFDSTYVQASSRGLLEKGIGTLSDTIRSEDVLKVWDRTVDAGVPDTVIVTVISGNPDIALAFFSGSSADPYKRRMDYLVESDNNGAGIGETLIYTSATNQTLGFALLSKNGEAARISIPGVALAIGLSEFTASASPGVINIHWVTESEHDVLKFLVKRAAGTANYENAELVGEVEGHLTSPTSNIYNFEDKGIAKEEIFYYWLDEVTTDGNKIKHGPISVKGYPVKFSFIGPIPNPAYKKVRFSYSVPIISPCRIKIYNEQGRFIREIYEGHDSPGFYTFYWDGKNDNGRRVSSGIYFVRFEVGNYRNWKKIILIQ